MRTSRRFVPMTLGLLLGVSSIAQAEVNLTHQTGKAAPAYSFNPITGEPVEHTGVCKDTGGKRCFARVVTHDGGHVTPNAAVQGFGPPDLQSAYKITPASQSVGTIAIVDAYGYKNLEADLKVYRAQYGLPACTVASGCLKIVNQTGGATLPADPPADDDWTVETALDVDMASAACPGCKILVVQATDNQGDGLYIANNTAATLGATVISNSWGGPEQGTESQTESYFAHSGIAIFVSAGDAGYNDNGQGPDYPATSSHTISVGATALTKTGSGRGWTEKTWGDGNIATDGAGGSACSKSIPKPSYQPANTACQFKATSDVSAVGDPATGLAIYDSKAGGWMVIGGTSASSPMIAAMFAGAGKGTVTGSFFYQNMTMFNDVTTGTNGTCGNILCKAGAGWDGPTGVGTPNMQLVKGGGTTTGGSATLAITFPQDGATVGEGFQISSSAMNIISAELYIDGTMVDSDDTAPFNFIAPSDLTDGSHAIEVRGYDESGAPTSSSVNVTVADGGSTTDPTGGGTTTGGTATNGDSNDVIGGCAAGGSSTGAGLILALGAVLVRRRRR